MAREVDRLMIIRRETHDSSSSSYSTFRLNNDTSRKILVLNVTDLPRLCPFNETHDDLEEDLKGFLDEFNQTKSFYSPSDRLLLHEYFILSYKQCRLVNQSTPILEYLQQLADHAFRVQESFSIDKSIDQKSDEQRNLEEKLKKNHDDILELISQNETTISSKIVELRKEVAKLTRQLTREIQKQTYKRNTTFSSSFSTSTIESMDSQTTTLQVSNRFAFILSPKYYSSLQDQMNSDLKIIFILFSLSFLTFLILCWKRVEERKYLIYFMIYLCFMSVCYMI